MARIRTIKPEFWDSPGTARASLRARLFFIAMWNYADDWGIGDGHPLRLLSFAFPNDESSDVEPRNFRLLAAEVAECFDVQWYEVDGRAFYSIPSWEDHQRTEKKAKRKNPAPDQADSWLYETATENPPLNRGLASDGKGKGEVGKGKKEQGGNRGDTPPPTPTCKRHPDGTDQPCAACKKARMEWENAQPKVSTPTPDAYEPNKTCAAGEHRWLGDGTCTRCTERKQ